MGFAASSGTGSMTSGNHLTPRFSSHTRTSCAADTSTDFITSGNAGYFSSCIRPFVAGTKRRDLPPGPVNYRRPTDHPFEQKFWHDMGDYICQHRKQFRSWEVVSSAEATRHQLLGCQCVFSTTDQHVPPYWPQPCSASSWLK